MSPRMAEPRIVVGLTEREVDTIVLAGRFLSRHVDVHPSAQRDLAETRYHLDMLVRRLEELRGNDPKEEEE